MLLPLPYLGATVTWTTCGCSQDCRNEASRPAVEKSGCGLAAPCSVRLWLGHCISYALANARIYIRGAGLGHAGHDQYGPFPQPGLDHLLDMDISIYPNAAIINSLGATKLRLVAPSALVPSFSLAGCGHRLACLPIALPNYSFRAEWSKLLGGQARVSNVESNNSSNPP